MAAIERCNIWYLMWNVCIQCRVSLFFNNLSPSCQWSWSRRKQSGKFPEFHSRLVLSSEICLLINLFKVKLSAWPESTFKTFSTLQVYSHPSVPDERKRGRVRKPGGNLIRYNLKAAKTNLSGPTPLGSFSYVVTLQVPHIMNARSIQEIRGGASLRAWQTLMW